jgi:hypothetical protein
VTFDGTYRHAPYQIWLLTCLGEAGADPARPEARRILKAEIDISRKERVDHGSDGDLDEDNPFYRRVLNFNDLGAY